MTAGAPTVASRFIKTLSGSAAGLPKTFWYLWGGSLLNRLGAFIFPMMTMYLTKHRGLSVTDAALVVSSYGVGSLLAAQAGGALADHLGRRKTMLVSLMSSATCMLCLGAADTRDTLAIAAFALGFTGDIYRPASMALLADVVPAPDRMRAFGILFWAFNLGFSFAAIVAGLLAPRIGFGWLFVVDAGTTLAWATLLYRTIPETKPPRTADASPGNHGSVLTPLFDSPFNLFLLAHLGMALVLFQFQVAMSADMVSKGLNETDFGLALAVNGVLIVLFQPLVTQRLAGIARSKVLAFAAICLGLGFGANAFAHGLPMYMLAVGVWTVGEICMAPANASIVADHSPADMRGRYQGAFGLVWSLGMVLAPVLSGRVIAAANTNALWAICAGLGLVTAAMHLSLGKARRRRLQQLGVSLLPGAD